DAVTNPTRRPWAVSEASSCADASIVSGTSSFLLWLSSIRQSAGGNHHEQGGSKTAHSRVKQQQWQPLRGRRRPPDFRPSYLAIEGNGWNEDEYHIENRIEQP